MSNNIKLLCLILKAQNINKSSEQGYAMAIVSMLSIIMLSLLAASMTFSNLAKTRTDAFVDSNSSFSVAESGLNKRAVEFKKVLETYSGVKDVSNATVGSLTNCFGADISTAEPTGTDYLGCRNYSFKSSNNTSRAVEGGNIALNSGKKTDGITDNVQNTYVAYTSISRNDPQFKPIPPTESFGGLNAAEYNYVIHSTAKRPVDSKGTVVATIAATPEEQAARAKAPADRTSDDLALIAAYDARQAAANVAATKSAAAGESSNNINLSMTFTNRVIPLFQFGVFYNGDVEFNSTSKMQMKGWVHSNANIYVQPAGESGQESLSVTTFLDKVSAAGRIYNRVDAFGILRTGITKVLLTGDDCTAPGTCGQFPAADTSSNTIDPLTATQLSAFKVGDVKKVLDGSGSDSDKAIKLKTPSPGFTRKRNYYYDTVGIYYAQADMRLEMVPDRDLGTNGKTTTPWDRNTAIIPFNFTSITTGTANCITARTTGSDPDADYIDPDLKREKYSTRHCNKFNKGQLQSLRQPVLVLKNPNTALVSVQDTILGKPIPPTGLPTLSKTTENDKILRALQVALVSTPSPIPFEQLTTPFNDPVYNSGSLSIFKTEFFRLIDNKITALNLVSTDPLNDKNKLLAVSPSQIAALQQAWFLPAPIQRIETANNNIDANVPDGTNGTIPNLRRSGFYDGREQRWITMLQTNIASLSVWNRDGLYVGALDETLTSAYATNDLEKNLAFDATKDLTLANGGVNFTNGLAFDRSAVDATKTPANLQSLGLGSSDTTEGGLVFHAAVSDNLNGNSTRNVLGRTSTINDSDDVTLDTTNPIYKKNPDNTNFEDDTLPASTTDRKVIVDYYRKYPGSTETAKSPFAFAFNGGNYLPSALLLSSDQAIYIQGNFNNNANSDICRNATLATGATPAAPSNRPNCQELAAPNTPSDYRLPASVIADTITALSNECISTTPTISNTNFFGVPAGQIKCGLRRALTSSIDSVGSPMALNAAFLSNTAVSNGNQGTDRYDSTKSMSYSGGVNNYIRLLEDWGNNFALNYTGSLISLGTPLEYSGLYQSGGLTTSYYNIPFRNFNYDEKFKDITKIPPLTPKASYVQQKNFSRTY